MEALAAGSAGSSGLGGGGGARWMVARVTWGWKCGKECGAFGFGWRDISCWRSADSGSEGISQIDMPASPLPRSQLRVCTIVSSLRDVPIVALVMMSQQIR